MNNIIDNMKGGGKITFFFLGLTFTGIAVILFILGGIVIDYYNKSVTESETTESETPDVINYNLGLSGIISGSILVALAIIFFCLLAVPGF